MPRPPDHRPAVLQAPPAAGTTAHPAGRWLAALATLLALAGCSRGSAPGWPGYAEAELVHLSSPLGGTLATLTVARGQHVAAGAPLFQLEAAAELLARQEAQARLEQAQAQSANLRKGARPLELQAAQQQLAQAQAALQASTAQLQRSEQLVRQGFIAAAQLDDLRAVRDRDAARVRELQARLGAARTAARPDEIAAAQAQRRAALQVLEQQRWREDQKQGRAPTAGVVFDLPFRPGEWVAPGQPVVVLLPDDGVKLRFFVPQDRLSQVQVGMPVTIHCDGCPAGLPATVNYVSPQAEFTPPVIYSNESRHKLVFMVEARPAPHSRLKPGQPVEVVPAASAPAS